MKVVNVEKLTEKKFKELLENSEISKSSKIKRLFLAGYTIKEISNFLNIRYNFAYNVISNYVITEQVEVFKEVNVESKKDLIIEQFKQGNSLKEISVNLRTNYNYVFNVVKSYKAEQVNE